MDIYLPIAEVSVNWPLLLLLGGLVGFVSGLLGIGGGFLMTPALLLLGIPPAVAVASMAQHVVASSTSSVIAYSRRGRVDVRMALVLSAGGVMGALLGVEAFRALRQSGQADLAVNVCYLLFLTIIGGLMLHESLGAMQQRRAGKSPPPPARRRPIWLYGLPWKVRFPQSRLYISVLPPLVVGAGVGVLSAIMGVGGGFILVPAMVYLLRVPGQLVVGTSLLEIIITASLTLVLQAGRNQTVDVVLGGLLVLGGVIGAQLGARASARFRAEELRAILAVIVLLIGLRMGLSLILPPDDPFVLIGGGGA